MIKGIIKVQNGRQVCFPIDTVKVSGIWGRGTVVYVTADRWVGVRLEGETRVDEYPGAHLTIEVS